MSYASKGKMFRVEIVIEGKSYQELVDCCGHALSQLKLETPSENLTFDDGSHVDYTVLEIDEYDSYVSQME
jgi:hypothetical protein